MQHNHLFFQENKQLLLKRAGKEEDREGQQREKKERQKKVMNGNLGNALQDQERTII